MFKPSLILGAVIIAAAFSFPSQAASPAPTAPVATQPLPLPGPNAPTAGNPQDPYNPLSNSAPAASSPPPANFDPFAAPSSAASAPMPVPPPPVAVAPMPPMPEASPDSSGALIVPSTPLTVPTPPIPPASSTTITSTTSSGSNPLGQGVNIEGAPPAMTGAMGMEEPPPIEMPKPKPKPKPFKPSIANGKKALERGQYDLARRNLLPFANKGDAVAQYWMGITYAQDKKKRNFQKAMEWYQKAAEQGNANAQFNLGFMLYNGSGQDDEDHMVGVNRAEAFRYLLAAANQGMPMAQHLVSLQYLRGDGTEMNLEQALRWSSAAAENGIAEAQYNAAMIGVRHDNASMQDYVNSYKWFTILAARGYPGSIHNREQIMQFMTPEAIDEGNRLAQQWQPPADSEMGLREEEAEKPGIKVKGGKAKPRR